MDPLRNLTEGIHFSEETSNLKAALHFAKVHELRNTDARNKITFSDERKAELPSHKWQFDRKRQKIELTHVKQ